MGDDLTKLEVPAVGQKFRLAGKERTRIELDSEGMFDIMGSLTPDGVKEDDDEETLKQKARKVKFSGPQGFACLNAIIAPRLTWAEFKGIDKSEFRLVFNLSTAAASEFGTIMSDAKKKEGD